MTTSKDRDEFRAMVTALALAGDAGDRVRYAPDLDRVDRELASEELEAAVHHIVLALQELPHWRGMPESKRVWALTTYGDRYRRRLPDPSCVACLTEGAEQHLFFCLGRAPEGPCADELSRAVSHLHHALVVVGPETFQLRIAHSRPEQRVALGEQLRAMREDVEAERRLVRSRLGAG